MRTLMHRPSRRRGFTLLEVVVSLAILSIAGVVLATGFASFLQNYHAAFNRSRDPEDVALVRAALLAEPDVEKVEDWNDLELPEDRKARWRATVEPTTIADLFSVTCEVEIRSPDESEPVQTTLHLNLLRPTWSQPDERETLRAASRDRLADRKFE